MRLLPLLRLLFLIGCCGNSKAGSLTWNHKYRICLMSRGLGSAEGARGAPTRPVKQCDGQDTLEECWDKKSFTITAGGKSGSVSGLISSCVWPAGLMKAARLSYLSRRIFQELSRGAGKRTEVGQIMCSASEKGVHAIDD